MGPRRPHRRQPRRLARPGRVGIDEIADRVRTIHRSLEEAGIPHAFGGALALGHYAESREIGDVDVNVFVTVDRWSEVREALAPLGVDVEVDEAELEREGHVKLAWDDRPLHLFFSCDPLHAEMEERVRAVPVDGGTLPLVAPEHLVIRKRILDRPKDRRDIEQIFAHAPSIDRNEVDRWVQRLGADSA